MRQLIVLIILSSVLSACSSSKKGLSFFSRSSATEKSIVNDVKFIDAISLKNSGNYEKAEQLLLDIVKSKETTAPAHYELSKIYLKTSQNEKALFHINAAVDLNPKNKWYINGKIDLTRKVALYEECEKTFLLRKKMFPKNTDYDVELSDFYVTYKKYLKALKVYDEIEEEIGISHNVNFNKFLIYKGLDEYEKSENEIKKLIETFPANSEYYIHYADFKFEHGEDEKALNIYEKALEISPDDPYILNEKARYLFANHKTDEAIIIYKKVMADPSFKVSEKRQIIRKFTRVAQGDNKIYNFSKEIIEIAAKTHHYDPSINMQAGDFMFGERDFEGAITFYERTIEVKPNNYNAWMQLILCFYNTSKYDKMIEKSEEAIELFPSQPSFYFYNGMGNIQKEQYNKAIEVLEEGNDLVISSDKKLKAQFLSSLGDAFYAVKKYDESDEYFDLSLEIEPNNYYVLNNYAYYLSERNTDLSRAKEMSMKSNQLNPDESSFQDTYGWILYQLGDFKNALKWLEKSLINGGDQSGVINEHVGDVYLKLNNKKSAIKYWKKAQELGGGSDKLEEKLKKN